MSENKFIQIGDAQVALTSRKVTVRVKQPNPEKPGKTKMVDSETHIIAPQLDTVDDYKGFFSIIVDAAEAKEAGAGAKLGWALLGARVTDAFDEGFSLEDGREDTEKYVLTLISPSRPRSSGMSTEEVNQKIADLALEIVQLSGVASDPDGWQTLADATGAQIFASQDLYLTRFMEVQDQIKRLLQIQEAKAVKLAKSRADREAKAAAAAAALKGVVKTGEPAAEPAN